MDLSKEDIKQIANEVYRLQVKNKSSNGSIYCEEWVKLRKKISEWILTNLNRTKYSYSSVEAQIYGAIKFVTGCKGLRDMTNEQAKDARWIFEQMKAGFEKNRS